MVIKEWSAQIDGKKYDCKAPCTVLSVLQENGSIGDLYYGTQEVQARQYFEKDAVFTAIFSVAAELCSKKNVVLVLERIDTLCEVVLNGEPLGNADNFHRVWRFDVKKKLRVGTNVLELRFSSAVRYARERMEQLYVWGNSLENGTLPGISYVRKPYYTFGWDWCPPFPDQGILGEVRIEARDLPQIGGVLVRQTHSQGKVTLDIDTEGDGRIVTVLFSPDGRELCRAEGAHAECLIAQPQLWWPNGCGEQPLYLLRTELYCKEELADVREQRIGLRTISIDTADDAFGRAFTFVCNGVRIFAKGANIVPYDCLLWKDVRAREEDLLQACKGANYNMLRIWGGGMYGSDTFYDRCDELGILVWQDLMIACAHIRLDDALERTLLAEAEENVRRIRNHPSLALLCGNNEMEPCAHDLAVRKNFPDADKIVADYLYLYEEKFPALTARIAPQTAYWPSSPSAGGKFFKSEDANFGDSHFWKVWGELKPVQEYREHFFRFLSEFGFIGFPSLHTLDAFSEKADRNVYSEVMECHQKNFAGNAKCAYYLRDYFEFPADFSRFVFATQYIQADALETAVAHMRSHYGRCMGSLIWQLNDAYPAISFSLIDYYGRRKPAFYVVKREYRNICLFAAHKERKVTLRYVNETPHERKCVVEVWLADGKFGRVYEGKQSVTLQPFSAGDAFVRDLRAELAGRERELFFGYRLLEDGKELGRGSLLFVAPKLFRWAKGKIGICRDGARVTVRSDVFRKFVKIEGDDELPLDDNCFDLIDTGPVVCTIEGNAESAGELRAVSLSDIN